MLSVGDPYFALPASPPAPAGTYPFRVRGSVYQRDLEGYRALLSERQLATALASLPEPPTFERFILQTFAATGWYDLAPALYMRTAVARALNVPPAIVVRDVMAHQLQHSLGGVTGILLKKATLSSVTAWLPQVVGAHYDFGRIDITPVGPTRVRCARSGVPRLFVRFWATAISEFIELALKNAGAQSPRVTFLSAVSQGEDRGFEVFSVPYEVAWG
jgi:hypothetical protein